jgi:acyl dehydratase
MAMGQKFFEDFVLGETFDIPSKTLTDSHFLLFAAVTGDNHPIHYDREYCRARGYPERLAHGYLVTVQTVLGASSLSFMAREHSSFSGAVVALSQTGFCGRHTTPATDGGRTDPSPHHRPGKVARYRAQPA